VHADRTITVRLPAPQVSTVALLFGGSKPMTKDAAGLWSITIVPVEPEIYTYNFVVDGVRILDAGTNNINVPHGALGMRTYTSSPLQILRQVYVYPPPQYAAEPNRKFPVLYLRHGSGDSEQNWSDTGRAGVILDNLIAEHKAQPMTIVMPNCDVATTSPVEVLRAASK
jgi:enterochelin esterase-like enzyme